MLLCPQGISWSHKVQLLVEEYPLKIIVYFLPGILLYMLFKRQFHALRFLQKQPTLSKGFVICIEGVPFRRRSKTLPYSAILLHKDCCVSWRLLSQRNATPFERNIGHTRTYVTCMYMYIYIYIYMIISTY